MYSKYLKYKHNYLNLKKLYVCENKENEYNRLVFSNLSCTVSPVPADLIARVLSN